MSNSSLVSGLSEASRARFSWVEVSRKSENRNKIKTRKTRPTEGILKALVGGGGSCHGSRPALGRLRGRPGDEGLGGGARPLAREADLHGGRLRGVSRANPQSVPSRPHIMAIVCIFPTLWETSTKENLALEASDRPETRPELLARLSSARFFLHFLISSKNKTLSYFLSLSRTLSNFLEASSSSFLEPSLTFTSTPGPRAQGYPRGSLTFALTPGGPAHSENAPRRLRAEARLPRFLRNPGATN